MVDTRTHEDRVKLDLDGSIDEVVITGGRGGLAWLHVEEMDRDTRGYRWFWMTLAGQDMWVQVSPRGQAVLITREQDLP